MSRVAFLAGIAVAAFLGVVFAGVVTADTDSPPALTGTVRSQPEAAMEGVLVGARKAGSTIRTWVVSNAQGQYSFPRERLEPGKYTIRIRAVGYQLAETTVDVGAQTTRLDLPLEKVPGVSRLAVQLSNAE